MSTWLSEIASSHRLQLSVTAVVSAAVAITAVIGLQNAKRAYNVNDLKDSIPQSDEKHDVERVCRTVNRKGFELG